MAPRKAAKPTAKKPKPEPAAKAPAPSAAPAAKSKAPRKKSAAAPAKPAQGPGERTRVIFPREVYDARKEEIKAPLKDLGLKWQYLGTGKGRYAGEGIQVFVQHTDAGADFTYWGASAEAREKIRAAWEGIPTQSTAAVEREEKAAELSEAMKLWQLQEPMQRPGEPDGFFRRRVAEWEAKRPES